MEYMLCYPGLDNMTPEKCEKVHNILARMSEKYKVRVEPEPVKSTFYRCPPYFRKYRIMKPLKEREAGGGEAFLDRTEEEMLLGSCRDDEEKLVMKNCIYAYQYQNGLVLKAFRDKDKKRIVQGEGHDRRKKQEA